MIGMVQATEAVKLLLGIGDPLVGRLLTYDALGMRFREVKLRRDPKCPLCGQNPTIRDLSIHRSEGAACAPEAGHGNGQPAGAVPAGKARGERVRIVWRTGDALTDRLPPHPCPSPPGGEKGSGARELFLLCDDVVLD